jgi:hypothetical protein
MSVAEITSAIDRLTPEERVAVKLHLRRRTSEDTPERRRELAQIMAEMDAGRKLTMADFRQRDAELSAQGR